MHQPKFPYPAWDYNWDGRMTPSTSLESHRKGLARNVRGKTRHIILVRHGQYDESSKDDEHRKLTPLGRLQATKTGQRLAEWTKGSSNFDDPSFHGPCPIKAIRVSNMTRAKETAQLIAKELGGGFKVEKPDPLLNEALPAPMIPIRPDISGAEEEIDENRDRIEEAFRKYFYRRTDNEHPSTSDEDGESSSEEEEDEFEIIVCHGNVIRYLFCRALQFPPEAWLRMSIFNCSLTYLMVRPDGTVSARMLGDIGHLNYEESTFSGYHGLKW
jgi:serine/threonine-protein phosphatase PGAM5